MLTFQPSRAAIAVVLTAGLAVAGCGGSSSKVSADKYVTSVCTTVGNWLKDVKNRETALQSTAGSSVPNGAQGKALLKTFMSGVVTDTDKALSAIKGAGTPDISGGSDVAKKFVDAFTQARSVLQDTSGKVDQLPTGDPAAFKTAATQIGQSAEQSLSSIGTSLGALNNGQLKTAGQKSAACTSLKAA